jgi:hypothetical protein
VFTELYKTRSKVSKSWAIAKAITRRLLNVQVQSQGNPCEIYCDKAETGQVLRAIQVPPVIYYFNNIPYSSINRADIIGPPEAQEPNK